VVLFDNKYKIMINEIYVNEELVLNSSPIKQFKNGYKIRCVRCKELIERKWYDGKILQTLYNCKNCVLRYENPMYNDEVREKHSKIVKSKEYRENMRILTSGKNNGFYGKTHTVETMNIIKCKLATYWDSMDNQTRENWSNIASERECKLMADNPIKYRRSKSFGGRASVLNQLKYNSMNKIETIIYDYIKQYNSEVKFSIILASYQFDFGIKSKKVLIEVDGDYWHGNPMYYNSDGSNGKKKLNETQLKKIERDVEKTKWAESRGFTVIRIWENEIYNKTFTEKLNGYI
jgi:very-short-patch-repair endonuclease